MDRRDFLKGSALAGATLAGSSLMFGCSSQPQSTDEGTAATSDELQIDGNAIDISEEISCDIVVVGAGNSGLTAAVQAAELGANTILLEVNQVHGTNTEGMFAVNSHYQQEQNIDLTMAELITKEESFFNYRVNALYWKDMIENSGENIDWLEQYGVQFSGEVDTYGNMGHVPTFHWFVDGKGSNMTDPLEASAKELGVDIRYETRGRKLIIEDGAVKGIYAENVADQTYIKITCKAVILATGGFVGDLERMASLGIPEKDVALLTVGRVGDGISMALEAGGVDRSAKSYFLREASFLENGWLAPLPNFAIYTGMPIWINETGERFANELCSEEASGCVTNAHYTQQKKFALWGKEAYELADDSVKEEIESALSEDEAKLMKFETLDELSAKLELDASVLSQTVSEYNEFCKNGSDEHFGKSKDALVTINAPYYIGEFSAMNMQSIGGIEVNRKMEVVSSDGASIPGLYAVGTDSCMLYGETYTITVPASCNGNNINSGRVAAKNAVEAYLK